MRQVVTPPMPCSSVSASRTTSKRHAVGRADRVRDGREARERPGDPRRGDDEALAGGAGEDVVLAGHEEVEEKF